jgi:PAS domain S-box-containing protein
MKKSTYIYGRFERFWHWSQALLIFFLVLTGFEVHSSYHIFGFENAVNWHNLAAWAFLILIIFAIFWHFVTGEWRQYVPTTKYMKAQINYYIFGIFKGAPHPTHKTIYNKFNPLQRFTYLGLKLIVIPVQVISGFLFLYYMSPNTVLDHGGLNTVAVLHTLGAFLLIVFIIIHVYLTTTGETPLTSIKAMLTGWEEVHVDKDEENREHLKSAVQKSVAGYYRINTNGYYEDVNEAWLNLYGYSKDEIIGKHYSLSRDKENLKELDDIVLNVLQGKPMSNMMVIRKCKDGSLKKHFLSVNPVYENDEIAGMEGFILDIDDK